MAFQIFRSTDSDKFYFRLKANNGEIILQSEAYERKEGAQKGINSVIQNADQSNFEKKIAKDSRFYFVLKAKNNEIIGTSQMYQSQQGMEKGIVSVINHAQAGEVADLTN